MRAITLALLALMAGPVHARIESPVTNGGFETLDASYFPAHWSPVGSGVGVTTEARTGRYALRMNRSASKPMPPETGLNRGWSPTGGQGAMLEQKAGILRAWVRVRSASPDASIALVVIPMGEAGIENTGEMRAMRNVPIAFAGDGLWHELRLAYDYTANRAVRWVHVGMRLTGGPADVLLDDVDLMEQAAAILLIEKVHVYPDRADPGRRATLTASVINDGTAATGPATVALHLPDGMSAVGPTTTPELRPGDGTTMRWTLNGPMRSGRLVIRAQSGDDSAEQVVWLKPRLEVLSVLASPGVVMPNAAGKVFVTLWNRGTAVSPVTSARLTAFGGARPASGEIVFPEILPGRRVVREVVVRTPMAPGSACGIACAVEGAQSTGSTRATFEVTDATRARPDRVMPGVVLRTGSDRTIAEMVRADGQTIARMPHLGRVTLRLPDGHSQTLMARFGVPRKASNGVSLRSVQRDRAGGNWTMAATFRRLNAQATRVSVEVSCDRPRRVAMFEGPMLLVGDGSTGASKSEAIFPGLEWLENDEVSSSDLDILASHPDRPRYAPHPHKVTIPAMSVSGSFGTIALLWDMADKWDGLHDRPQPLFASPDRIGGIAAHRMGLIAPGPVLQNPTAESGVAEAHFSREAAVRDPSRDVLVPAGRRLVLTAVVFSGPRGSTALDGVESWFAWFRPAPPAPAPRGDDLAQAAWSMQAYMKSLWDSPETGWFPYLLGPAIWRHPSLNPSYAFDLQQATRVLPDHPARADWQARLAETGFAGPPGSVAGARIPSADDMLFGEGDPIISLAQHASAALSLISSQAPDGSYAFDADRRDTGVFKGYDYHELGEPGAVEIGLIAAKAYQMLLIARLTGDPSFYEAGLRSLQRMESFRVPRAVQVWEVPVHTPDILAAADAVDAYLEAYWYSGETRWLARAKLWARRGLPFVYVWNAPGKLWMRYGSIPVFGATQMRGSWFGHLVQWNGLRYALALLKLHQHDPAARYGGLSWRDLAIGITRSAMYQQSDTPETLALWPDAMHTITGARAAWEFAPRQILKNVMWWMGRPEVPLTRRVPTGGGEVIRVSAIGRLDDVRYGGGQVIVTVAHPPRSRGSILIAGVTEPTEVRIGDDVVPRSQQGIVAGLLGWRYDARLRAVAVHVPRDGPVTVRVAGVRPIAPDLVVPRSDSIAFEFEQGFDGWSAQNDTVDFEVRDGVLHGKSSGGDPFLVRPNCSIPGDSVAEVVIRLKADGHGGGQFYWTTAASPAFDEQKVLRFAFEPDNQWHEIVIPVGDHPHWRGQTVTGIRIDPVNAANVAFAIDWVRAR